MEISYYLLLTVFAELNREKFISIAACIYNNIGIDDDMAFICLNDKDATEKMVKKQKIIFFFNSQFNAI